MAFVSRFNLLRLVTLWLIALGRAQYTTIGFGDSRLVTVPPGLWSSSSDFVTSGCGGFAWLNITGQSVSLSFQGTVVEINFLYSPVGAVAQIAIDGTSVNQINTQGPANCAGLQWTSSSLAPGQHTLTVTWASLGPASGPFVAIQSFAYLSLIPSNLPSAAITPSTAIQPATSPVDPPSTTTAPSTTAPSTIRMATNTAVESSSDTGLPATTANPSSPSSTSSSSDALTKNQKYILIATFLGVGIPAILTLGALYYQRLGYKLGLKKEEREARQ